jgi:hypothetical protein
MLLLINHRYPRLGAILSALSSVAFITLGVAEHSMFLIVSSAAFLALPIVKTVYKRRGTPQAQS